MKNSLFTVFFLFIAIIHTANAQIGFGIKAGVNYSIIEGDWNKFPGPSDSIADFRDSVSFLIASFPQFGHILKQQDEVADHKTKNKIGAHGGIFLNIPITNNFSVQPEIVFSMKGASAEYQNIYDFAGDSTAHIIHPSSGDTLESYYFTGNLNLKYDLNYRANLYYIDVPILAKYKFNNGISLEAGPSFNFLTFSREKYETTLTGVLNITQTDLSDNTTTTLYDTTTSIFNEEIIKSNDNLRIVEIGFSAGIGYEFPFGLGIFAGYSGGLSELFKNKNQDGFRNSIFHFSLRYRIFSDLFKPA